MTVKPDDVTVVIPSLPDRAGWLERAVRSAVRQSAPPADVIVHVDHDRVGAYAARNAALKQVRTEWVAFLDDDDIFHRDHLKTLIAGADRFGADLIYTYPMPEPAGQRLSLACCRKGIRCPPLAVQWGPEQREHFDTRKGEICSLCGTPRGSFIMVTNLVRTEAIERIGGFPAPGSMGDDFIGHSAEDYLFLLRLLDTGARFHHVIGYRTWTYHTGNVH